MRNSIDLFLWKFYFYYIESHPLHKSYSIFIQKILTVTYCTVGTLLFLVYFIQFNYPIYLIDDGWLRSIHNFNTPPQARDVYIIQS